LTARYDDGRAEVVQQMFKAGDVSEDASMPRRVTINLGD